MLEKRLKYYRNFKKLTQTDVGEELGLTKSTISAYEKGTSTPPLQILVKYSEIFGVNLETLITGREVKQKISDINVITVLTQNQILEQKLCEDKQKSKVIALELFKKYKKITEMGAVTVHYHEDEIDNKEILKLDFSLNLEDLDLFM